MNAPAKIAPARERYETIVRHHLAGCSGKELELRCSILLMRDKAQSHMRGCSEEAYGVLEQVWRLGVLYAYELMPIGELEELRYRMLQLTQTASGLEQMAFRLAHPGGSGGDDAGG